MLQNRKCCVLEKTPEMISRMLSVAQLLTMQDELNKLIDPSWYSVLSADHFRTAIISEAGEYLNDHDGPIWKWWSFTQEVEDFNKFPLDIEICDITHFYLSLMILFIKSNIDPHNFCKMEDEFEAFDDYYVGSDMGAFHVGVGLLCGQYNLSHHAFMNMVRLAIGDAEDIFEMIDNLDSIVSAGGFTCEYFSALYMSKYTLNQLRRDPNWEKIDEGGVEDNDRLEPLIQSHMNDPDSSLQDLRQAVIDEFFEEVGP